MRNLSLVLILSLATTAAACGKKNDEAKGAGKAPAPMTAPPPVAAPTPPPAPPAPPPPMAAKNIVEVATAAGSFKTLLTAVEAAGLVGALSGPGPFTVFAPTDEAFAKIPAADLQALLADKAKLSAVLTYHVVSGTVLAKDVGGLKSAKTLQGAELAIDTSSGVKVGGANVVATDIMASNGVIHVVDTVLMPPK